MRCLQHQIAGLACHGVIQSQTADRLQSAVACRLERSGNSQISTGFGRDSALADCAGQTEVMADIGCQRACAADRGGDDRIRIKLVG